MSHKGPPGEPGIVDTLAIGVISGEPIETYHATDAWSKSKLDDFRKLPLLAFKKYVEKSIPREPLSETFRIGLGAHALTLEGEAAYNAGFVVVPDDAPRYPTPAQWSAKKPSEETIAAISWWTDFNKVNGGKIIIPPAEDKTNHAIRDSVRQHPFASILLAEQGEAELTFRVQTPRYHIQCRADYINRQGASRELVDLLRAQNVFMDVGEPYVCDFKTVASLSDLDFHNFTKNFSTYGYHRQGPFYRAVIKDAAGLSVDRFFFIATEKNPPYSTAIFLPSDQANATGWQETVDSLQRLNECYDSGVWPGIQPGVQLVDLPHWYKSKEGGAL